METSSSGEVSTWRSTTLAGLHASPGSSWRARYRTAASCCCAARAMAPVNHPNFSGTPPGSSRAFSSACTRSRSWMSFAAPKARRRGSTSRRSAPSSVWNGRLSRSSADRAVLPATARTPCSPSSTRCSGRNAPAPSKAWGSTRRWGYLHALRPGRPALALDLMEELRSLAADRLAVTLINRRQLRADNFDVLEGGAVRLTDEGRRTVLSAYQERKKRPVTHRLLRQKVALGLVPHVQARLLARHLRGDLAHYPPYVAR